MNPRLNLLLVTGLLTVFAALPTRSAPADVTETATEAAVYFRAPGDLSLYFNEREVARGEILCVDECLERWIPFSAESYESIDGHWSVIRRPDDSLQWAFKAMPLYTYERDSFAGARVGEGADRGVWKVLKAFRRVPPGMRIETTLLGYVLADHAGHTLYVRDGANPGDVGDGAGVEGPWERFVAPWLAVDQDELTIGTPVPGTRQWLFRGKPLYTYSKDVDPGDAKGHGSDDSWSAVILEQAPGLPSWMTVQLTDLGLAYADGEGMTLYAPIDMEVINAAQTCSESCLKENWSPVLAGPDEESVGDWIIRVNDGGQRQWTYKGRFAWTYTHDEAPGDMRGHGIAVGYRIGEGWRIIPVEAGLRRDRS